MKRLSLLLALGTFSIGGLVAAPIWAQTQASDGEILVDMTALTCADLLRTSGEEREDLIILMHGFLLGKAGNTTVDTLALGAATDRIIESCVSNTSQPLMGTFEAANQSDS